MIYRVIHQRVRFNPFTLSTHVVYEGFSWLKSRLWFAWLAFANLGPFDCITIEAKKEVST